MNGRNNKRDIVERIKSQFSAAYLTLISMIEASILGFLIYRYDVTSKLVYINISTPDNIVILCEYTTVFLTIVAVWGEFVMGSMLFKWIPGIADAFIPFVMGITQVGTVFFIGYDLSSYWLFSLASMCIVSWWAYRNMYQKSERNREDNEPVFTALSTWRKRNNTIMATLAGTLTIVGIVISIYSLKWLNITISCLICISAILYVVKCYHYWQAIKNVLRL